MGRRANIAVAIPSLALAVVGASCSTSSAGPPGPIRFRAQAADVAFESTAPARIDLALGSTASAFELSAAAASDRGVWNIRATLTREQVTAGTATLEVGPSGVVPATLQINGSRPLQADTGTLDVSFGAGQTSGAVTAASPELLDSTFSGEMQVSCWVPASALPAESRPAGDGIAAPGGGEALVLDAKFESGACMAFQSLQ